MKAMKTEWWMSNEWEKLGEDGAYERWARKPRWFLPLLNFVRRLYYRIKGTPSYSCRFVVYVPKNWEGYTRVRQIEHVAAIS